MKKLPVYLYLIYLVFTIFFFLLYHDSGMLMEAQSNKKDFISPSIIICLITPMLNFAILWCIGKFFNRDSNAKFVLLSSLLITILMCLFFYPLV